MIGYSGVYRLHGFEENGIVSGIMSYSPDNTHVLFSNGVWFMPINICNLYNLKKSKDSETQAIINYEKYITKYQNSLKSLEVKFNTVEEAKTAMLNIRIDENYHKGHGKILKPY